jgi:hypothetical protein
MSDSIPEWVLTNPDYRSWNDALKYDVGLKTSLENVLKELKGRPPQSLYTGMQPSAKDHADVRSLEVKKKDEGITVIEKKIAECEARIKWYNKSLQV